ncbi:MAG: thioredoxin [Prevotella sp.]
MSRTLVLKSLVLLFGLTFGVSACSQQKQPSTEQQQQVKEKKTMKVKELTTEEFKNKVMNYEKHPNEWVFEGERPVIIDFYATWCGPCKMTAPIVEQIADKYDGKVDVYKVDVDKEQQLAAMFGIQSIPSLLFIPMKEKPQMSVGAMSFGQLDSAVTDIFKFK